MKSTEIRQKYLEFFENKNHTIVASDNIVPQKDPSLLFTTAGMVQFKPLWIGAPLSYNRATSVQKCLRAGGKGSDLENVGKTLRHHTFFEMLGNFSFGDYFKDDAIAFAWEFLMDVLKIDKEKLWVSVYKDDDEAYDVWTKKIGFPAERIVKLGDEDNFWGPAGPTGACGPSSEIYIDLGSEKSCGQETCGVGCDCERYLEFWNIVFPQFDQQEDGSRQPLQRRGIDTGMGLERLSMIMQNVDNNYETDLFKPIIDEISKLAGVAYDETNAHAFHVVADHVRALTFTFAENILPSNEGRGYVLRRILRRACRFGMKLGFDEAFIYKLVPVVAGIMGETYPEVVQTQGNVANLIKVEEENFDTTLNACKSMLDEVINEASETKTIKGDDIFRLYDTYGLPVDMLEDIADENDFSMDYDGFNHLMSEQKHRAKSAQDKKGSLMFEAQNKIFSQYGDKFQADPYGQQEVETVVVEILDEDGNGLDDISSDVYIIVEQNPCYGEAGGQIGDTGVIIGDNFKGEIEDSIKFIPEITTLKVKVCEGAVKKGDKVVVKRDQERRAGVAANHTATHLLHYVLRQVLGDTVSQAGSYVGADRLRFDFTYFKAITEEELNKIERMVNERVFANRAVHLANKPIKDALAEGVTALFGEKYGDVVRVVSVGDFSNELCGGTHVENTGDIGLFKIINESSIASGTRRIEAVTGMQAYDLVCEKEKKLKQVMQTLKVGPQDLVSRVTHLLDDLKEKDKTIKNIKRKDSAGLVDDIIAEAKDFKDIKLIVKKVDMDDAGLIKDMVDKIKAKLNDVVIVFGADINGKAVFVVGVSDSLVEKGYHAGRIVGEVAKKAGGGGGGRPDFAQAGSKEPENIEEALSIVEGLC